MKKVKNKKILKLLSLTMVVGMIFSMSVGFTYAPEEVKVNMCDACADCAVADDNCTVGCDDPCVADMGLQTNDSAAVAVIPIDESDVDSLITGTLDSYSYDLGLATYTYADTELVATNEDLEVMDYSPTVDPNGEVTITASVQYPEDADGATGYLQIYYLGPDDTVFDEYLETAKTVATDIDPTQTYTGTHTFTDLECGMHKVIYKFYSSNDDVNAVYTKASTIIVSGEITEMSTIADVTMTSGTDKVVSFTYSTNGDLGTMSYTWFLNNVAYEVTNDPEITLNDIPAGIYTMFCQLVPSVGVTEATNSFTVTVAPAVGAGGITIVSQPADIQVKEGEAAVMSVSLTAEEGTEIDYAWYINDNEIENSNMPTITFKNLEKGNYDVYCEYTVDGEDTYSTEEATISVVSEDAAATPAPDADDEEEKVKLSEKLKDWYEENQTLALVLIIAGICGGVYVIKRR